MILEKIEGWLLEQGIAVPMVQLEKGVFRCQFITEVDGQLVASLPEKPFSRNPRGLISQFPYRLPESGIDSCPYLWNWISFGGRNRRRSVVVQHSLAVYTSLDLEDLISIDCVPKNIVERNLIHRHPDASIFTTPEEARVFVEARIQSENIALKSN